MRITGISYERLELELTEPYTIAYESIDRATNFILILQTESGLRGYGCAAPDPVVTGETGDMVEQAIKLVIAPALLGENPFHYARILAQLARHLKSSALAMVDIALHDLMAKRAGVPLYKFMGGYRDRIATSVTIGILPLADTLQKAREWLNADFHIIKLKGGLDVEEDVNKLRALRKRYPDLVLRFDGNQGYDLAMAQYFISATKKLGIEVLEQPTHVDNEQLMGILSQESKLPVMADESLKSLADAFRLTSNGYSDMINIKIMKVGGLLAANHINSVAKAGENEVMVGCLDECGLGISAGLHFALSKPNVIFADLDGNLDFKEDPYGAAYVLEKGFLRPNNKLGVGW